MTGSAAIAEAASRSAGAQQAPLRKAGARAFFSLFLSCAPVLSEPTTVYRTIDEQGTVTFSDQPPADTPAERVMIEVPPPADPALAEARLQAMRETTERMAADRRERETARAAVAAARTPEPAPGPRTLVVPAAPLYRWPAYQRPWRPRPPVRPHPVRPPLRPGQSVLPLENNQQLMRRMLPSRR